MNGLAFALCLLGLWISFYFTGVSYHWFPPNVKWIPRFCQLKESSCQLVLETPRAKLFGIPNSVFGIVLYAYLALLFLPVPLKGTGTFWGTGTLFWNLAVVATALAGLRSLYLAYSLIFVTKVPCPLCFTSHVINLILFIYLWLGR